jgi:ABC-type uncharacterized transport system permease subunit
MLYFLFDVGTTIRDWLISQVGTVADFLLLIIYFTLCMYLTVKILQFWKRSDLEDSKSLFWRSFLATFVIGILFGIIAIIFVVIFVIMLIGALGGAGNVFNTLVYDNVNNFFTSLAASSPEQIFLVVIAGAVIILIVGLAMKLLFKVPFGWGLLGVILTFAIGILIEFILEQFHISLFSLFQTWATALQTYLQHLVNPMSS